MKTQKTHKNRKTVKMLKKYTAGQVVQYDIKSPWHFNWTPLNVHNMDCGPNCFCLLGYSSWETSNKLALRTPDGITGEETLLILNEAYGTKHEWVHIPSDNYKKLNDYLHMNEATLASIGTDELAHYFVVLRNKQGLHTIDAQGGYSRPLKDYIRSMEDRGYAENTFYIVSSRHTLTGPKDYDKVTMKLVKKYFPMKKEVGVEMNREEMNREEPDRVLTKEERRHQREILRWIGFETSPGSSLNSSLDSIPNSNEEWTLRTSLSRSGRRAKSERKYKSKYKSKSKSTSKSKNKSKNRSTSTSTF